MNNKLRMWMCKRLLKHIETMERDLPVYKERLRTHLKVLPSDDFFRFCIETGYPESAFKSNKNKFNEK